MPTTFVADEEFLRRRQPVPAQGTSIEAVVRGYLAYHAVPTNSRRLGRFRTEVIRAWFRALPRRSPIVADGLESHEPLGQTVVPSQRILHPFPEQRFDDRSRGRSRVQ